MAVRVNAIQGVADHAGPHKYWNFKRPNLCKGKRFQMLPTSLTALRVASGALRLILVIGMVGCGGSYQGIDLDACEAFPSHSVWKVLLDYGGGMTAEQTWTIDKHLCSLAFVAEPFDEYAPGPGSTAYGFIQAPGFVAQWYNHVGSCSYAADVTATLAGTSFTAQIAWTRSLVGSGECQPAQGQITATAVRQ